MAKENLRNIAIDLRKRGLTYAEILKQIPVAKSTLSLWLKSVGLSKEQNQRITEKKLASARRGGQAKHLQRLALVEKINKESASEIGSITKRELWLMGIMLYWAEGSKEKDYAPGSPADFSNSDPRMIRLFLIWLRDAIGLGDEDIFIELYVHETRKDDIPKMIKIWSRHIGFPKSKFRHIYLKKGKTKTNRKNVGDLYLGILRVRVRASSKLNRRISGWVQGGLQ
jgi:hypothetical protein